MDHSDFAARIETAEAKPVWADPAIVVESVRATASDPTTNDDGLGNGAAS